MNNTIGGARKAGDEKNERRVYLVFAESGRSAAKKENEITIRLPNPGSAETTSIRARHWIDLVKLKGFTFN